MIHITLDQLVLAVGWRAAIRLIVLRSRVEGPTLSYHYRKVAW